MTDLAEDRKKAERELAEELGLHPGDHILIGNQPMWIEKLWEALVSARIAQAGLKEAGQPSELLYTLKQARIFIEYAHYELQDGKAAIGDQFPRKDDAFEMMRKIDKVLNSTGASGVAQTSQPPDVRELAAACYQLAGVLNAPVRVLDSLSAVAQGEPFINFLPVSPDERGAFTEPGVERMTQPEPTCICDPADYPGADDGGWDKDCPLHGERMASQPQLASEHWERSAAKEIVTTFFPDPPGMVTKQALDAMELIIRRWAEPQPERDK